MSALQGFLLGASLIIAIGAQNAFVLRQGILRRHVLPIVLFCAAADAVLIATGVAGFGSLIASNPVLLVLIGFAGAAFLAAYGLLALRRAVRPLAMAGCEAEVLPLGRALATVATFTFLNPHVYLDTVVLLGSIAGRFPLQDQHRVRWWSHGGVGRLVLLAGLRRPLACAGYCPPRGVARSRQSDRGRDVWIVGYNRP
jgi:L-lysine exporter family protein LysE/ArgO